MPLGKVTIYKIKDGIRFEDFFKANVATVREAQPEIDFDGGVTVRLAFKSTGGAEKNENDIPWLAFFNEALPEASRYRFNSRNRFPSGAAAIGLQTGEATDWFVLTFGLGGEGYVDPNAVVRDFGLRVGMNICNPDRVKRVRTSVHEAISTQSERQVSAGSSISVFNIDDDREFLRSLAGAVGPEFAFIASFTGRDSINIKTDREQPLSWADIAQRVADLNDAYKSVAYKDRFAGYDRFRFETDRETIAQLDERLFESIAGGDHRGVHLAPPELFAYDDYSFAYSRDEGADLFDDLDLNDFLASRRAFSERSSVRSLKTARVYAFDDETGRYTKSWSVYDCVVAEIERDNLIYILSMGQWKLVASELKEEIEQYLQGVEVVELPYLPNQISIWNAAEEENQEDVYNKQASADNGDIYRFDQAKIVIAGKKSYEVCDLFRSDRTFVHVKRFKSGSASVTHLFVQGRFYADAFVGDGECRTSMREYIVGKPDNKDTLQFLDVIPEDRANLIANNYSVVFCILVTEDGFGLDSLPFMTRYEIVHSHKHLKNVHGMNCTMTFPRVTIGP